MTVKVEPPVIVEQCSLTTS